MQKFHTVLGVTDFEKRKNMKYIKQFLIIIAISFIGELLNMCLPLPIPASIYGMLIMFIGLLSGIIKLESVRETGIFLIEIMPVMFIPAGVGLINSWGTLREIIIPIGVIIVVSNIAVMVATGKVSHMIIKKQVKKEDE